VLPFHQMGAFKWQTLGLEYQLSSKPTPTDAQVRAALEIFRGAGCRAR
jgi:pyruvate formate lyase activating enzyme